MCDTSTAIKIMNEVVDRAKAMPWGDSFVDAYLFGSYARGDYNDESDIDIFLTFAKSAEEIRKIDKDFAYIGSDVSLEHNITVSTVISSNDEFVRYADVMPLYVNILTEGVKYGQ